MFNRLGHSCTELSWISTPPPKHSMQPRAKLETSAYETIRQPEDGTSCDIVEGIRGGGGGGVK